MSSRPRTSEAQATRPERARQGTATSHQSSTSSPPRAASYPSPSPSRSAGCASGLRDLFLSAAPEPLRRDRCTLDHGTQFLERNVGVELAVAGKGAKAAIAAGDPPRAAARARAAA